MCVIPCFLCTIPKPIPCTRGDDPQAYLSDAVAGACSPPTRGWTLSIAACLDSFQGFPAHAGMDPAGREVRPRSFGFPRPRGDGPHSECSPANASKVSPPTRGWTRGERLDDREPWGFPAHAGMDPCGLGPSTRTRWFPRPRGDGPAARTSRPAARRFPRPRGDGPQLRQALSAGAVVSPPTRGFSVTLIRHENRAFPARAAICLRTPATPAPLQTGPRTPGRLDHRAPKTPLRSVALNTALHSHPIHLRVTFHDNTPAPTRPNPGRQAAQGPTRAGGDNGGSARASHGPGHH